MQKQIPFGNDRKKGKDICFCLSFAVCFSLAGARPQDYCQRQRALHTIEAPGAG